MKNKLWLEEKLRDLTSEAKRLENKIKELTLSEQTVQSGYVGGLLSECRAKSEIIQEIIGHSEDQTHCRHCYNDFNREDMILTYKGLICRSCHKCLQDIEKIEGEHKQLLKDHEELKRNYDVLVSHKMQLAIDNLNEQNNVDYRDQNKT